ncbi:zinc-dependent alcohol dehydrogenase [Paenibacillus dakarensis]|uniref:zinc-dependent alcohol dehydrogenase n=1 Tax=Paenibacillus dakarensis TaxID=1527293 RepID=UPI0006D5B10E|nr:zinc-binding dehydrogenase [Paenibacillus dakarensis]
MKGLFVDGVKKISLRECEEPAVKGRDVLVKMKARGICGTDLNSYRTGKAMGFGHEMAGIIEKVGEDSSFKVGTKVFVSNLSQKLVSYSPENGYAYLGGFADKILVKDAVENVDIYPVPDTMTFSEIALIEPFSVGMSGVKKYQFNQNSKVVILGAGIIGMCAFEYLKSQGVANIVVIDINQQRLEKSEKAGAIPYNSKNENMAEFLTEKFGQNFSMIAGAVPDVDLFIDAAGVGSLLNQALSMTKIGAHITVLAAYHNQPELDLTSLMYNSVKIAGSCMFTHDNICEAIKILSESHEIADNLVSHEIPFDQAEKAFEIADDATQSLKVMMIS